MFLSDLYLTIYGGVERPNKKIYIFLRSDELANRSNDLLIRLNESVICSNESVICSNDLLIRPNEEIFFLFGLSTQP